MELSNGSVIQLHGADHPDSLRGVRHDCAVLDEFADMDPEAWLTVVRPALTDRKGRVIFLGTPRSYNHFYDLYMAAKQGQIGLRFTLAPMKEATCRVKNRLQ